MSVEIDKSHEQFCSDITKVSVQACKINSLVLKLLFDGYGCKPLKPDKDGWTGGGDWALNEGSVTLVSLLKAIKNGGFKGTVQIISIVPYAGGWAVEAKRLWTKKHQCVSQFKGIYVQAACESNSSIYTS